MTGKTIAIDSEGYFKLADGLRFNDETTGRQWLQDLQLDPYGVCSFEHRGERVIVEPFDKPYVAQQVYFEDKLQILLPYDLHCEVVLESMCVDAWDRFHGLTKSGVPFVLSRKAQAELFNLATEFTDDSLTLGTKIIHTPNYYVDRRDILENSFWSQVYQENPIPPWDLEQPHPSLSGILAQIKPLKGRVAVPGCGRGHDAHFFAQKGHVVTAFDFSPLALNSARELYGQDSINFEQANALELGQSKAKCFDYIFEHTLYCAIHPDQRKLLIKNWWQILADEGHLFGIFFVNPIRTGPPFGGSEWELKNLLDPYFDSLYWTRLKDSPGWRNGIELFVYAKKRNEIKR